MATVLPGFAWMGIFLPFLPFASMGEHTNAGAEYLRLLWRLLQPYINTKYFCTSIFDVSIGVLRVFVSKQTFKYMDMFSI